MYNRTSVGIYQVDFIIIQCCMFITIANIKVYTVCDKKSNELYDYFQVDILQSQCCHVSNDNVYACYVTGQYILEYLLLLWLF